MYVEKIEIPAFRVLRDVVLEFGGGYDPQIFPIGSENGGGKSTLLQLVFALLHCSVPSRFAYLKNILASGLHAGNDEERLVARLTLNIDGKSHAFEFITLHSDFLRQKLENPPRAGFNVWDELELLVTSIRRDEREAARYRRTIDLLPPDAADEHFYVKLGSTETIGEARERLSSEIDQLEQRLKDTTEARRALQADANRIVEFLGTALDYDLITTHAHHTPTGWETRALICHVPGQNALKTRELLVAAASKVFLLGPSNQQYLFLDKSARRALLSPTPPRSPEFEGEDPPRPQIEYLTKLDQAERTMPGFYAYDWLSVEPLVQLFESARDEDFKNVVKNGSYGDSYSNLMGDVNELLLGKKVRPLDDLSGVEFVVEDKDGRETPLSPEDLSLGELKRLMIYAWLRAKKAVDALVLIDEIEASLHPDWQVGIVRDLQEWAPKNQYLLATHSYELCQALTPRHVRELQPRLAWRDTTAAEAEGHEPRDEG
jgi:AAA domain, putative AbiEii toxin, Type IV TA system/AAA domain